MDLRIGAKSPVYNVRQTSKVADKVLKADFAKMIAETKPVNQDTVEISGNPLTQRLENVHQKINEMVFTGKTSEEVYRSVLDAYEDEFGYVNIFFHTDEETYNEIVADREKLFSEKVPNYETAKLAQNNKSSSLLYYRAMGYDKMTNEEKIDAIKKRIPGDSYVHKSVIIAEMHRANLISSEQRSKLFWSLNHKAEKEYCATQGLDYIQWSRGKGLSKEGLELRQKSLMEWKAKTEITWLEVFESVHDYPALNKEENTLFLAEIEEISNLLVRE